MWRKYWLGLIILFFSLLILPDTHVYAADNAYVSCLYDEDTMCYRTSVIYSGDEVELELLKKFHSGDNYFGVQLEVEDDVKDRGSYSLYYINGLPEPIITAIAPGNFCGFMLSETMYRPTCIVKTTDETLDRTAGNPNAVTSVCTFPTNYHHNATQADINRAYEVADVLGGDLTKALIFLNDEKSFNTVGDRQYLYQMRYSLLKGLQKEVEFINAYGSKYNITPNGDTVTIKKLGHYEEWKASTTTVGDGDWDKFVTEYNQAARTFTWRMSKGYKEKVTSGKSNGVYFNDGYKGLNLLDGGVYSDLKVDEIEEAWGGTYDDKISWVHLIVEADLAMNAGITYQTSSDLYAFDSTNNEIITKIVGTLNDLESSLDCYSISDLVFNGGVFATDGYYYGCFPSGWLTYINTFYVIFSIIALSLVALSLTISLGKNTISSASASARFTLMQDVSNLFVSALFIVVGLGLINIMFYMSDLLVSIFADISTATGRTIESLQPTRNGHNLATALMQFGYFGLKVYINITYVMRRFLLMGMMAAAPIFIIAFSFGQKGKEITMRWLSELIGHITIQPVQAATFAVILTVSTGLRGVESVALLCCILPLTNFYRGLITKGGNFAVQQGSKLGGSLIGQQASMMGAQAMIDATEEGRDMGARLGTGIGALGGLIAGGVPGAIAGGAAGAATGAKLGANIGRAEGQQMQAAYQTGGSMANMIASGGDDSGVASGLGGIASAYVAKINAQLDAADTVAKSVQGAAGGYTGAHNAGAGVGTVAKSAAAGAALSAVGMSGPMSPYGNNIRTGESQTTVEQANNNASSMLQTKLGENVKVSCNTDSQGRVSNGEAVIKRPPQDSERTSMAQATAYDSLFNAVRQAQSNGALYNHGASVMQDPSVRSALTNAGLNAASISSIHASNSGTIKVQIDSSQMAELIKGVTNSTNNNY